jgi:hypothetical protein
MSDQNTPNPAAEVAAPSPVIDPVAEARKIMAGQGPAADDLAGLKRQVKALWVISIVALVLAIVVGASSLLPRTFGGGRGNFPAGFQPGMQGTPGQDGAPGAGAGQGNGAPGQGNGAPQQP